MVEKSQIFDPYASTIKVANIKMINKELNKPTELIKKPQKTKGKDLFRKVHAKIKRRRAGKLTSTFRPRLVEMTERRIR